MGKVKSISVDLRRTGIFQNKIREEMVERISEIMWEEEKFKTSIKSNIKIMKENKIKIEHK